MDRILSDNVAAHPLAGRLQCPGCKHKLRVNANSFHCSVCDKTYGYDQGIPLLFLPNDWAPGKEDITSAMKSFYETTPFPNYDEFDNVGTLMEKARKGVFARMLDKQIPFGAKVLDCGCGTGQLTNFLSIGNRSVTGSDMCLNSLTLAQAFKTKMGLHRAQFVQMNLFRPVFAPDTFDVVISNGVLHHTSDPHLVFNTISTLVRPSGYLIAGLYHRYGRIFNDLRRHIFNMTGNRMKFLDTRLRLRKFSDVRKDTWFADQYKNPHESKHTIHEVLGWLDEAGFDFISSIPKSRLFDPMKNHDHLFTPQEPGSRLELGLHEMLMTITNSKEGGFFVVIGKKRDHTRVEDL